MEGAALMVSVAASEVALAQVPETTQWYLYEFIPAVAPVIVKVAVVTPV